MIDQTVEMRLFVTCHNPIARPRTVQASKCWDLTSVGGEFAVAACAFKPRFFGRPAVDVDAFTDEACHQDRGGPGKIGDGACTMSNITLGQNVHQKISCTAEVRTER